MNAVRRMGIAVSAAALTSITAFGGVANATPATGVSGTVLWQRTIGDKDYVYREITVQPGGSTGWHHHDGTLYAFVARGTLTHSEAAGCATDGVYGAGSVFTEPSGADHVHIGRNLGSTPVVLDVLYVDPAGAPLSRDEPNPGCDFE